MKNLTSALQAHIAGHGTTIATCWQVTRQDGVVQRSTDHDREVAISNSTPIDGLEGVYQAFTGLMASNIRSAADLAVDNLEVRGQIGTGSIDVPVADIEAGLYDDAEIVLFLVNWMSPDDGQIILRRGTIGNIKRSSDGEYTAELRGLTQKLTQTIVRTYGVRCDADLGDARCGVDLEPLTITGTVTSVTSRRRFAATFDLPSPAPDVDYYDGGLLTFSSGANDGYAQEVRRGIGAGSPAQLDEVELFLPFPAAVTTGDTFTLRPGCDKRKQTCIKTFDNVANFRGYGVYTPGPADVIRGGREPVGIPDGLLDKLNVDLEE